MRKIVTIVLFGMVVSFGNTFAQLPSNVKCWQAPNILADSAKNLADNTVVYDPSYRQIPYPNGDVPPKIGVCTDVVVRAFRKAFNWDLQKSIYEFRKAKKQPTNTNIDHRRVVNMMAYFDEVKTLRNDKGGKFRKGNIVVWKLTNGRLHIGILVEDDVIIHNICCGQVVERMYMEELVIRNYTWHCPELEGLSHKEIYEKFKAGKL
ncbi:MAG: DUF1287 domain-containing protein [Bacteroidales bacterium]|nr:DUF1287 domain-containing protein [Bacteroidales bacterium]